MDVYGIFHNSRKFITCFSSNTDDPCSFHINSGPYYSDHQADVAFAGIQEWLDDCICNHPACSSFQDVELPTTTIDVGCSGIESGIRLFDNSSHTEKGQYIALSYVWGVSKEAIVPEDPDGTILRDLYLNNENRERYFQEVPEAKLPQTIREAIFITRKLGVRYLWVDALCIIQDDKAFKKNELLNMHHIFRNSYLTIRAACTTTVFDSFLFKRPHPDVPDQRLAYWADDYGPAYAYLRCVPSPIPAGIESRAWCYEESVLPKRVLSYHETGMRFDCCTGIKDEGGSAQDFAMRGGILRSFNLPTWRDKVEIEPPLQDVNLETDPKLIKLRLWYGDLDVDYTVRFLSNSSDRLPAIAGVVREIQHSIGDVYVSGIWKADLPWGLLWWTRGSALSSAESADYERSLGQYIGPSWSWATLGTSTFHQFLSRVTETIVCEVVQFPDEDDYLGDELIPKVLRISATATLGYTCPISEISQVLQDDQAPRRFANCMIRRGPDSPASSGLCERLAVAKFDIWDGMEDQSVEVTCVFITKQVGMMLKRCEEFPGHYCRLGLFTDYQDFYDDGLAISDFSII